MKYKMIVDVDTHISWQDPYDITTFYYHKLYEERYFLGFIKNWCRVYTTTTKVFPDISMQHDKEILKIALLS